MDRYNVGVPFGLLRIESVGSTIGPPLSDPAVTKVHSHEECVLVAVGPDELDIGISTEDGEDEGTCVFDGVLTVLEDGVEVADMIGDDFRHHCPMPPGPVRLRVWVNDPAGPERVRIRLTRQ